MAGKDKDFYENATAREFVFTTLIGLAATATMFFSEFHDKNKDGRPRWVRFRLLTPLLRRPKRPNAWPFSIQQLEGSDLCAAPLQ